MRHLNLCIASFLVSTAPATAQEIYARDAAECIYPLNSTLCLTIDPYTEFWVASEYGYVKGVIEERYRGQRNNLEAALIATNLFWDELDDWLLSKSSASLFELEEAAERIADSIVNGGLFPADFYLSRCQRHLTSPIRIGDGVCK